MKRCFMYHSQCQRAYAGFFLLLLTLVGCSTHDVPATASDESAVRDDKVHAYLPLVVIYRIASFEGPAAQIPEGIPYAIGTGIIIGPHHVLTAAHNFYDDDSPDVPIEERIAEYAVAVDPQVTQLNGSNPYYDFTAGSQHEMAYVVTNRSPKDSWETRYADNDLAVVITTGDTEFPPERFARIPSLRHYDLGFNSNGYNCDYLLVGYGAPDGQRRAASMCVVDFDQQELTRQLPPENAHWVLDYQPLHYVHRASERIQSKDRMDLKYAGTNCLGDSGAPILDYAGRVISIHKGGVPLTEDGTEQLCLDSKRIVNQGANLNKYWGWINRIARLCTPLMTKIQCNAAIEEKTCGNLGSEQGYEQSDIRCYQRSVFQSVDQPYAGDPLAPFVQGIFERATNNADIELSPDWPASWTVLDRGQWQSGCDLCIAHEWN